MRWLLYFQTEPVQLLVMSLIISEKCSVVKESFPRVMTTLALSVH